MSTPTRLLTVLAVCGALGGGAVALVQGQPARATANTVPVPAGATVTTTLSPPSAAHVTVQLLIDQANQLQRAISAVRAALASSQAVSPKAGTAATGVAPLGPSATPVVGGSSGLAQSQQLAAQQSALNAERQQLAAQAQSLANEAQQLATEQAQLEQEAQQLAAAQSAPTTTTSTSAPTRRQDS